MLEINIPSNINYLLFLNSFSRAHLSRISPNTAFHIQTNHLLFTTNHLTGFYMKKQTGPKCTVSSWNLDKSATFNPAIKYMNKLINENTENSICSKLQR